MNGRALVLVCLLSLAACGSPPVCEREGGIGGTGGCPPQSQQE